MEQKYCLILDDNFIQYCKINNINDIEDFAKIVFNKGYLMIKYGDKPKIIDNNIINIENQQPKEDDGGDIIKQSINTVIERKDTVKPLKNDLYEE